MLAYLRCLAQVRAAGFVFLIAISGGGCAADRASSNPGASATRAPANVVLTRGDACDSQTHHLSLYNKHNSETFAVKVRWYRADGEEITRTVFVEPRTSVELGCAASEEEILEVTPT